MDSPDLSRLEAGFELSGWRVRPHANALQPPGVGTGEAIHVEPRTMQVLLLLAARQGEFVSKHELLDTLWADRCVTEDVIVFAIGSLRRAFGDDAQDPHFIETRKGIGYRLLPAVRTSVATAARWRALLAGGLGLGAAAALTAVLLLGGRAVPPAAEDLPVLAVLPFAPLADAPRETLIADAVTDGLIMRLAERGRFRVVSRTSIMPYRDSSQSAGEIAAELGADLLVEGSVLSEGGKIRINAQLIDARRDLHLWARQFDRPAGDILALQQEIAGAIASQLGADPDPPLERVARVPEDILPAYLQANYLLLRADAEDFLQARQLYEEMLTAHPAFAPAHLGYARASLGAYVQLAAPLSALEAASVHAERAFELGAESSTLHATLGQILFFRDWDFAAADRHYRRALELNPSDTAARTKYAWLLVAAGRYAEAEEQIAQLELLDPHYYAGTGGARLMLATGRYEEAIERLETLARLRPDYSRIAFWLGIAYAAVDRDDAAAQAWIRCVELDGASPQVVAELREVLQLDGAAAVYRQLLAVPQMGSATTRAWLHARLGETDEAIQLITQAIAERDPQALYIGTRPELARLLADPRLADLRAMLPIS